MIASKSFSKKNTQQLLLIIFISACFWLPGCSSLQVPSAKTPEEAVVNDLLARNDPNSATIPPGSVQVLQSQPFNEAVIVMVRYQMVDSNTVYRCEAIRTVEKRGLGWVSGSGGSGCASNNQPLEDISASSGQYGSNGDSTSYAYGIVNNPEITTVAVAWSDDSVQETSVINGSYLVIQPGEVEQLWLEDRSSAGNVIFSYHPEVAPGKTK